MPKHDRPKAWSDLITALELLAQHPGDLNSPLHCEHDQLTVMADPVDFTAEEITQLEELGFDPSNDAPTFHSFRFGSA